jgi:hypothetical protein
MRCIYTLIVANFIEVSMVIVMITPRQIRTARALLGWSQQRLADTTPFMACWALAIDIARTIVTAQVEMI